MKERVFQMKTFFKEHFSITYSRTTCIVGGGMGVLLLALTLFCTNSYLKEPTPARITLFVTCIIASLLVGALFVFRIRWKDRMIASLFHTVLFFLLPIAIVTMSEALNGVFVYDMTYTGFGRNYMLVLLLQILLYAVSGSFKASFFVLNPLVFALSLVHHYFVLFRGTPFVPVDIFTVGLADTILEQYSYLPDYQIACAVIVLVFIIGVGLYIATPKLKTVIRILVRSVSGILVTAVFCVFFFTSFFANMGVKPDFWNQSRGYRNYGFFYSFFINMKYLYVLEPTDYDADKVEGYVENVLTDAEQPKTDDVKPDIICIMNETLTDLKSLGEFSTNREVMPFISSLQENTVKGNLYVPVIGAGTSNTEFEFLTGHSTAFLPSGSNAYTLYVKEEMPTLATLLQQQGYEITAMHPYYADGWNRSRVYPLLGMDLFYSIEDMLDMRIFREYRKKGQDIDYLEDLMQAAYPDENILMRQYVSDSYNYRWIIEDYETRDETKPYFMFNVTMQNHGGYRKDAKNFPQNVWLTETDAYPETNRFLSLVQHSDDAFKELISYFETVDRPVVICLFGDHQPAIEDAFVEEVLGSSLNSLTLAKQQARHVTPFVIWANYDIEEKEIQALSSNYLSSVLLQTAGLEMSEYNRYLLELSKQLPVIDTVGYMDAHGNLYSWNSNAYQQILQQYQHVQYNCVLDTGNRKEGLFTIKN